jgi:transposase
MELSEQDRVELFAAVKSDAYDGSVSSRAQIVLWYGEGRRKSEIAAVLKTTRPTVDKWIQRYEDYGVEGLVNRTSPGGPRQIPDRIRSRVLALTRVSPPSTLGISHWSSSEMSKYIKKTRVSMCRGRGCVSCGGRMGLSHGGREHSKFPGIQILRRKCGISSGCM